MDRCFVELLFTEGATAEAEQIRKAIASHPVLSETVDFWSNSRSPRHADLYTLVVVVSDDLAGASDILDKIYRASACGFPIIPVVRSLKDYRFDAAPIDIIREHNAVDLVEPDRLVDSLLHHGGLRLLGGDGSVFISYARADGAVIAEAIRSALRGVGLHATVDVYDLSGGDEVGEEIAARIRGADLTIVVDSLGASRSPWVADEIDIAMAAHRPIVAVTPDNQFHHFVEPYHVKWEGANQDPTEKVVDHVRRVLARRCTFRARVQRVLARLARLRQWSLTQDGERWMLRPSLTTSLAIACHPDRPCVEDVVLLSQAVAPTRAILVAGTRPLLRATVTGLRDAGGEVVRVVPLPSMAAGIPSHCGGKPLNGLRVFLSAAMPSDADDIELARSTLPTFVVGLCQSLLGLGATLVFGGHPSVTSLVHKAVEELEDSGTLAIELHQAEYWRRASRALKPAVREGPVFRRVRWHGAGQDAAADVQSLRDGMIDASLWAAIFVGGRTSGYVGSRPGIHDEYDRFRERCPGRHALVLGLSGGAAARLACPVGATAAAIFEATDPDMAVALVIAELVGV